MLIATWNLNNRVGKCRFRPEAVDAAINLGADVIVFTEFYPQDHEDTFRTALSNAGWTEQRISRKPEGVANRVLIASKIQMEPMDLNLLVIDKVFLSNLCGVKLPSLGLSVPGVRVPAYQGDTAHLLIPAWNWIEKTATLLKDSPSLIVGDLNVQTPATRSRAGDHFRRILANGWTRAEGAGPTFFGHKGRTSEVDHVLATSHCIISEAVCVKNSPISDHAALVCRVELRGSEVE